MTFRAVAADRAYGDQDGFRRELCSAGLPFVMALKPSHGTWAYGKDAYTPVHAARALAWTGPESPGDWTPVGRTFRDGHTETWWAADANLGFWGPDGNVRLVVATTDPTDLPSQSTWYLATDLPRPGSPRPDRSAPRLPVREGRRAALRGRRSSGRGSCRTRSACRDALGGPS
ncbi:hypothetical protein [Streptomyces sp. SID12501]|uniref:hypothetical protein n=1 Tax=Streptomyces sp. SID12501 TaxID=2706042 RepID=UPI0023B2A227|nr:hypothetical protein [Streptomyces sp. SID12501]